jgi:hypothetical protein
MCEIAINTGPHQEHSEIEISISGTCAEYASASKNLNGLTTGVFPLKHKPNKYYPLIISELSVDMMSQSNGVFVAQIEGAELRLSADSQAFRKLTEFLANVSTLDAGGHVHLDWFANPDLLAPATDNMSFVFYIEG